jgi:hypothetical protein
MLAANAARAEPSAKPPKKSRGLNIPENDARIPRSSCLQESGVLGLPGDDDFDVHAPVLHFSWKSQALRALFGYKDSRFGILGFPASIILRPQPNHARADFATLSERGFSPFPPGSPNTTCSRQAAYTFA